MKKRKFDTISSDFKQHQNHKIVPNPIDIINTIENNTNSEPLNTLPIVFSTSPKNFIKTERRPIKVDKIILTSDPKHPLYKKLHCVKVENLFENHEYDIEEDPLLALELEEQEQKIKIEETNDLNLYFTGEDSITDIAASLSESCNSYWLGEQNNH